MVAIKLSLRLARLKELWRDLRLLTVTRKVIRQKNGRYTLYKVLTRRLYCDCPEFKANAVCEHTTTEKFSNRKF